MTSPPGGKLPSNFSVPNVQQHPEIVFTQSGSHTTALTSVNCAMVAACFNSSSRPWGCAPRCGGGEASGAGHTPAGNAVKLASGDPWHLSSARLGSGRQPASPQPTPHRCRSRGPPPPRCPAASASHAEWCLRGAVHESMNGCCQSSCGGAAEFLLRVGPPRSGLTLCGKAREDPDEHFDGIV